MKAKRPFVREEVTREQAKALFEEMGERYKLELIDAIAEGRDDHALPARQPRKGDAKTGSTCAVDPTCQPPVISAPSS